METALQINNLSCTISGHSILNDISLTVAQGEYLSILGHNGSGKSTLIKCIMGIEKQHSGTIKINGRMRDDYTRLELAKIVSYVPQKTSLDLTMSVTDFVLLSRFPYQRGLALVNRADKQIVAESLELVNMSSFSDRYINTLSGGELQKVVIASALAQQPDIIVLDEPVSFLDPKYQIEIYRLLHQINRLNNVTVIEVTHEINSAARFAQKVLALKNGQRIFFDTPEIMMSNEILREIFDTDFILVEHPQLPGKLALPSADGGA